MNFFEYLDIKFQKCAVNKQTMYSVKAEQETKAVYMILQAYRWIHKWLAVPRVLFDYVMVCTGFREIPISPLAAPKPTELKAVDNGTDPQTAS